MDKLTLIVVSQEKQLLELQVDSVSLPTVHGEITVLPKHIPLFAPLQSGELIYRSDKVERAMVVSAGFVDVGPEQTVTVMVDSAVHDRDISVTKAQEAIKNAQTTLLQTADRAELIRAEAELRRALLELKVAQKTKKSNL